MEKKPRKPWSDAARARHKAGIARYQKRCQEYELFRIMCEFARILDVDVRMLGKTLIATDKVTLYKISEIEPQEERLRVVKNLVIDYCQGVTA